MNTVLQQELVRYNGLLSAIRTSLEEVRGGLRGQTLLSAAGERVSDALLFGRVPDFWLHRSYPSRKPLGAYILDLHERTRFFQAGIYLPPSRTPQVRLNQKVGKII